MANSMLDSVLGLVTPEISQSLATRLGESPEAVQTGLRTASGATLQGLASRATDTGFTSQIMQMVSNAGGQNLIGNLSSIASSGSTGAFGDLTNRFTSLLFGNQQSQVATMVAQQSGVRVGSAGGLLKMAVPLVLAYLGRMSSSGSLTASSFASVFKSGTGDLGGYTLSPVGAGTVKDGVETTADTTGRAVRGLVTRPVDRPARWAIPLAIVAVAFIGWAIARSVSHHRTANVAVNNTACVATVGASRAANAMGSATNSAAASLGNLVPVTLPDGRQLSVPACGVEKRLIGYLSNTSEPAGAVTFVFDRVSFDPDSATPRAASSEQLNNVAAIMQAYPTAKIRLGGYSDNSGDVTANQRLSEERADGVVAELTKRGVDPSRLKAQDSGTANSMAGSSTAQAQPNAGISIRVAEK